MSGNVSTDDANNILRVENKSLKVKVENLETELENQQLKDEETMKTLRAGYEGQTQGSKENNCNSDGDLTEFRKKAAMFFPVFVSWAEWANNYISLTRYKCDNK